MSAPYLAQQPVTAYGHRFSDLKFSATLAATTDTTLTIPGSAPRFKAVMKCETDGVVYVADNATAAVPAGGTFAATTSEMIPVNGELCREVKAGDVLHFYTAGTSIDVSVVLYALNNTSGI